MQGQDTEPETSRPLRSESPDKGGLLRERGRLQYLKGGVTEYGSKVLLSLALGRPLDRGHKSMSPGLSLRTTR